MQPRESTIDDEFPRWARCPAAAVRNNIVIGRQRTTIDRERDASHDMGNVKQLREPERTRV